MDEEITNLHDLKEMHQTFGGMTPEEIVPHWDVITKYIQRNQHVGIDIGVSLHLEDELTMLVKSLAAQMAPTIFCDKYEEPEDVPPHLLDEFILAIGKTATAVMGVMIKEGIAEEYAKSHPQN